MPKCRDVFPRVGLSGDEEGTRFQLRKYFQELIQEFHQLLTYLSVVKIMHSIVFEAPIPCLLCSIKKIEAGHVCRMHPTMGSNYYSGFRGTTIDTQMLTEEEMVGRLGVCQLGWHW